MKRVLSIVLFCTVTFYLSTAFSFRSYATHLAGADLTYECLGGNQYEFELIWYRDCDGISAPFNETLRLTSQSLGTSFTTTLNAVAGTGTEITDPCSSTSSTCSGGSATGIEKWVYRRTVTLPAAATDWVFSVRRNARNNVITTVDLTTNSNGAFYTPGATGPYTYIEATLNNVIAPCNNSPQFSNEPITFFCVGQNSTYNHGVSDPDGDQLVYSLIPPKDAANADVVYNSPFNYLNPLNGSPAMTINASTGDLNVTPTSQEVSVMAVLVEEYRGGNLVGSAMRDMQVYVTNCPNTLPTASGINGGGSYATNTCEGQQICFTINSADPDPGQDVTMTWNNGIPGASFNVSGGSDPTGTFCWTPPTSAVTGNPHSFTVTVQDDACPNNGIQTYSYTLNVEGFTSVDLGPTVNECASSYTLTASVSGSGAPYTYNWSNGGSGQSITVTSSGTYEVTVSTPGGCDATDAVQVNLSQTGGLDLIAWTDTSVCSGEPVTIDAGSGFASYQWSNGASSQSITVTNPNNYSVTVTDNIGCQNIDDVTVNHYTDPSVDLGPTQTICQGESTTLNAGGGFSSYSWSTGASSQSITVSSANTYSVTVTDNNGCTATSSVTVNQPSAVTASIAGKNNVSCNGGSDGSINLSVSGGTPAYSYAWDNGDNTEDISGLTAGSYAVTVTDANGCSATTGANITEPSTLSVSVANTTDPGCSGGGNGAIDISVSGGTLNYSYSWSNGASLEDLSGVGAGSYSVTVTDDNGCTASASATLSQPSGLSVSIDNTQNIACNGGNDGSISITASGGTPGYSYAWSNGSSAEDLTNITAGSYSVTVTDANGCQETASATLTQPPVLTASLGVKNDVSCNSGNDGSIDITVNGGAGGYSYSWNNGETTQNISGLAAGTYTVTVIDNNGCTATTGATITQPSVLTASIVSTSNISCNGGNDGSINVDVSGGTPAYSYLWSNGASSQDLNGVTAGTYTLTITDANNCTTTASATLTEPQQLVITLASKSDVSCNAGSNGSADMNVSGGTQPYSFAWSNGASTEDIANVQAATYQLTVTDAKGCTATQSVNINEPPAISMTTSSSDVTCAGAGDGSITITNTNGGTPSYEYSIDGASFQTSTSFNNLSGGIYNVIVRDLNGCTLVVKDTIDEPSQLQVVVDSVQQIKCNGTSNGAIYITATGGTPGYTYQWTGGASSSDLAGVDAGSYTVTVTDQNGCSVTTSATITQPSSLSVSIAGTSNISCNGGSNGAVNLNVSGGTQPYTFSWSNGASSQNISGLSAGAYSVTVVDDNGCVVTRSATLTQPPPLSMTTASTDATCFGADNGTISISNANGGTSPYSYSIDGVSFQSSTNFTGLADGIYNVIVRDDNGCTLVVKDTIDQPTQVQVTVDSVEIPGCSGSSTGSIYITASGGTPGYSYQWSNGSTNEDLTNLNAGTYTVTATDNNGCTTTASITLSQPTALNVSVAGKSDVTCYGSSNGSIDISVSGGTPPYNYNWSNGATTEDLNGLSAGVYSLTISDNNGCDTTLTDSSLSFTINQPAALTMTTSSDDASCAGASDGSITITNTSGGNMPYQYSIDGVNYQASTTFSGLAADIYNIFLRDANNCTHVIKDTVGEPASLQVAISSVTNLTCYNDNSGGINIAISGGTSSYTYQWSNGSSNQNLSGVNGGSYTVTVTDANNCTATASANVNQPNQLSVGIAGQSDITCNGGNDGSVDINVNGGTQPYSFNWSNSATTQNISGVSAGNYVVTVADANGCTATKSVTLNEPPALSMTTSSSDVTCAGANDGSITVTNSSGGMAPYSYSLNGVTFQSSTSFNNLSGGIYNVIVRDANNCTHVVLDTVQEPSPLNVMIASTTNPSCNGDNTGEIDITVTGGTTGYTYQWSHGSTAGDQTGLGAGAYSLTVTDANNCTATASATLTQPSALTINVANQSDVTCNGGSDGSIDVSINGGNPSYTYVWSNGSSNEDLNNVQAGTYTLTVTDQNSCTAIRTVTLNEPPALSTTTTSTDVTCAGQNDGSLSINNTSGGTPPYQYSINGVNFQSSTNFTNLDGGIYNVIVRDANLCTFLVQDTINEPTQLQVVVDSLNQIECHGNTGGIFITASGGTPNYSYQWSHGPTSVDQTGLSAGSYTVTVTDENGCTTSATATLAQPNPLTINVNNTSDISCNGGNDGSISVNINGGTQPYSFSWSNGAVDEDLSNLPAGSYTLTVTDANNCTATQSVTLTEPNPISASTSKTNVSCAGADDGSITIVSATGGVSPYQYSLNGVSFQSSNLFNNLDGGIYNIIVRDANNCTLVINDTIDEATQLQVNIDSLHQPACNGSATGDVYITASGGTPGYTYNWSNGSTSPDLTNVGAGTYSVTVTDSNGCTVSRSATISQPGALAINIANSSNITCNGGNNGFINVSVNGGTQPYGYSWNNGSGNEDISNLTAGTYALTVTDANGCTVTRSVTLTEPPALSMTTSSTDVSCAGDANGGIFVTSTSGGVSPYQYSLNGVTYQSSGNFTGLSGGIYNVILRDANNCTFVVTDTIDEATPLVVSVDSILNPGCYGDSTGDIYITATGGVPGYSYNWSEGVTDEDLEGVEAGTYAVTVTDGNGCTATASGTINQPGSLTVVVASKANISCNGGNDGDIDISVSGGTQPYNYNWSNGFSSQDLTNITAGTYSVTVTDANGCDTSISVSITEPPALNMVTASTDATCPNGSDGSITVTSASGGVSPYQYSIDGVTYQTGTTFSGLNAGIYNVILRDANNCTFLVKDTIAEPAPLIATIDSLEQVACNGDSTGSIYISVEGGTPGYTYNWSNGSSDQDQSNLSAGNYSVTVIDGNGCTASVGTTLTEPSPISVIVAGKSDVSCYNGNDGAIDISVNGGSQPYSYAWSSGSTNEDISGKTAGTYSVTVTDNNGCTTTQSATIAQPTPLSMATQNYDVTCPGGNNGSISVTNVSGGTSPYLYSIDGANYQTDTSFNGLSAGIYNVIVRDSNNCTLVVKDTIKEPMPLLVTIDSVNEPGCNGGTNGAIFISVQGGTPGYTYSWTGGSSMKDLTNVGAGSYTVTVTDNNGCTATASASIMQPSDINISVAGKNDVSCFGGKDGSIDISVGGGTQPYSYAWSSGSTNEDITGKTAGTYTVTVTDNNGCNATQSVTLMEPTALSMTTNSVDASCEEGSDGSVTVTSTTGGTTPYEYSIDGVNYQGSTSFSGLSAGIYNVIVRDSNNCTLVVKDTVGEPNPIQVQVDSLDIPGCSGNSTGNIYITVTGGTPVYSYSWSNSSSDEDQTNLSAGTYTVTVTDANGCTATNTVTLTQPTPLNVSVAGKSDISCHGGSDGEIDISVSGGTQPYSFNWSNGAMTEDLNNVMAGTYSVTVTDANGCDTTFSDSSLSVVLTQPDPLAMATTSTDVSCAGGNDGLITIDSAWGGTTPYQYSIDGVSFQSDTSFSGLSAGIYNVVIRDANNCTQIVKDTIQEPAQLLVMVDTIDQLECNGTPDGAIDISVSGGTPGYSYSWTGGSSSQDLMNAAAGTYMVTVTDTNGCTATATATISQPGALSANIANTTNITCNGGNNGSIDINVTGGTQPYSYNWSNSAITEDLNGVVAGPYSVTVTDANGCTTTQSATLTEPDQLVMMTSNSDVSCADGSDGSITVDTAWGGVAPYLYSIDGVSFQSSTSFNALSAGIYNVVVRDANNCTYIVKDTVQEPSQLVVSIDALTQVECNSDSTGAIFISVSGGTSGYNFAWSNGSGNEDQNNLPAGSYTVTVTDGNGCTATTGATINQPSTLNVSVAGKSDVSCNGGKNGSIDISVSGGTQPYSYQWSSGSINQDLNGKTAGTYSVTVTDDNGCTATQSVTLTEPQPLNLSTTTTPVTCNGASDGSITVTGTSGGTSPYQYSIDGVNFQSGSIFTGLSAGIYNVIVTDSNNCSMVVKDTVESPAPLVATIDSIDQVSCNGGSTGAIYISVSGGTSGYSYLWSNDSTGQDQTGLSPGGYTVTVTDVNGCTTTASATITQPANLSVNVADQNNVTCNGGSNGSIDITAIGGVQPYSYQWSNSKVTEDLNGLSAGTYTVTVTDANGCTATQSIVITEPNALVMMTSSTDVSCYGGNDGSITIGNVVGGTSPYQYSIDGVSFQTSTSFNGLGAGIYNVIVRDANNCTLLVKDTIAEPAELQVTIDSTQQIGCNNTNSGAIYISVSGGTSGYSYLWSNDSTAQDQTGLNAGAYTVTVTDSNGCTATASATITQPPALNVSIASTNNIACNGGSTGSIDMTVSGGSQPYSYLWSNGAMTEDLNGVMAGTYTLTVTDDNGCAKTASVTLTEPDALTLATSSTDVSCYGENDGLITVTNTSGGVAPYAYSLNGVTFQIDTTFNNLDAGTYNVIVKDANNCTEVVQETITEPDQLQVVIDSVNQISCYGDSTGAIYISVIGGLSGPFQGAYSWSNGANTQDVTGLTAGTYTVTITDANGCTTTASTTITQPSELLITLAGKSNISCNGGNDGYIDINVSGGVQPYSYSWSSGSSNQNINGVGAGSYIVTVTDANSCTATQSVLLTEPAPLSMTTSTTDLVCAGDNDGSIVIATTSGGFTPYQYSLDGVSYQSSNIFNNLGAGIYNVVVRDSNDCTHVIKDTIAEPSQITIKVDSIDNPGCSGATTGSIYITASGGTPGYTYNWSGGYSTEDIVNVGAGTYTVTVTDSNGCTASITATITQPGSLNVSVASLTEIACNGGTNGSIDISVSGGTQPYTYSWNTGQTNEDLNNRPAGTYSVTVTDDNGCSGTRTVTLTEPPALSMSTASTDVSCAGGNDGSITVTVANGGTPPYVYSIDGVAYQTANGFNNLSAGIYNVFVRDSNNCVVSVKDTITQPATLMASIANQSTIQCHDDSTGSLQVSVAGGTLPYTYQWSNGASTAANNDLPAGTYTVTVTDGNQCSVVQSATIQQPSDIILTVADQTDVTCNGGKNGQIDISVLGGTPPYTYLWSNGKTTEDLSSLAAGTYTITVTDDNGCMANTSVTITQPAALALSISSTDVTCAGAANGMADLTVTGGTAPYSYSWSNLTYNEDASNLSGGTYSVVVVDSLGCQKTATVVIDEPEPIQMQATVQTPGCNGQVNGSIDLAVTGGKSPYSYLWSTGGTADSLSGVVAGVYGVTATDANGCSDSLVVTVGQPVKLAIAADVTDIGCSGQANGAIDVTVSGGTQPYSYTWSHGPTTEDVSGLTIGSYSVTVTDTNNCQVTRTFVVTQAPPLVVSGASVPVSCNGGNDGQIQINVSGGTSPYSYSWTTGSINKNLTNAAAGIYTVTVTDAQNCVTTYTDTITEPLALVVTGKKNNVSCNGGNDGAVDLIVSGGVSPYTYQWSNGDTTEDLSNAISGNYGVTVTDSNGCTGMYAGFINQPPALALSLTDTSVTCNGGADGSIYATVSGGVGGYTFDWSNGPVTQNQTGLSAGTYILTVTDSNNCTISASATVTQPMAVTIGVASKTDISCNGGNNGSIDISVSGGVQPYTYQWSNGASNEDLTNKTAGTYTVTVTDENGCTGTRSVVLTEPESLDITTASSDVTCGGADDGSITLTSVAGGTTPYQYSLNGVNYQSSNVFNNLSGGIYNVIVKDSNNCTAVVQDTIEEPQPIQVSIDSVKQILCYNNHTGEISVSVSGGVPGYDYDWSNGDSTQDLTDLPAGTYALTVTDTNGCTATVSATITQPSQLAVSLVNKQDITCNGDQDGSIDIAVSGGSKPYSFLWSDSVMVEDRSGLAADTFTVWVTDNNGCSDSLTVIIDEPNPLTMSTLSTDVSCAGAGDGGITVTNVTGGTPPYLYAIGNCLSFIPDSVFSTLGGGIYNVCIRDANGCTFFTTDTVHEPASLVANIDQQSGIQCHGDSTGSLTVNISGGLAPYSFSWSTGDTTQSIDSLGSGTYSVTVTDSNECTTVRSIVIQQPPAILVNLAGKKNVTCNGFEDGDVDITVNKGVPPYHYNWSNGDTTEDLSDLAADVYDLVVTDDNGCTSDTFSVTVNQPDPLSATAEITNVTCQNSQDGAIDATVTGGNGGYSYEWSLGDTSQDLQGLDPGDYVLTVIDGKGCVLEKTFTVNQADSISITVVDSSFASCDTSMDGSITVRAINGQGPYTYSWSNGMDGATIDSLPAGSYTVTVTGQNGCAITYTTELGVMFDTCVINYPPIAVDDTASTLKGEIVTVPVLNNDYDPNGHGLTVSIYTYPDNGSVLVNPSGTIDYEPYSGFTGIDSFQYIICDPTNLCDTATVYVEVQALPEVFIPNGFSPNGDGRNDEFEIVNLEHYRNEIIIYNRWGNEVYREKDYKNDWEGKYAGKSLPDATYYYILKIWDDDIARTYNGFVAIHRFKK